MLVLPVMPGFTSSDSGCSKASAATSMSFYMYRAQSDTSYPPENCDLASAAGVMWYLHNEVVKLCPRHYNISRVIRYNVTVFNPPSVYAMRQGQFGPFVAFDYGQCTVPDCPHLWEQYGYAVGCQKQDVTRWKYEDSFWYSLPGKCPSQKWSNKSSECAAQELGGNCSQPNGTQTCTWHAEQVGEVLVNDLSGISDLAAFCAAGNVEYDENTDKGRGCSFWDDKFNASRNKLLYLARSWFNGTPSDTELRTLADAPRPQLDTWKFPRLKRSCLPGPHMEPPVMQGLLWTKKLGRKPSSGVGSQLTFSADVCSQGLLRQGDSRRRGNKAAAVAGLEDSSWQLVALQLSKGPQAFADGVDEKDGEE
eukprot:s199_g25.t2